MRVLDLFSGIGGFSLGLERAGMKTVAFCEIEPFPRAVLRKHWPEVPIYEDVCKLTAERLAADGIAVDVICGGFPCQDISYAGKGAGLAGERSGLWREYARLIGEIRPSYVIVENVAALLNRGLGDVLADLAAIGFDAEWHCIPASAVGAPHRRDRLWIIAYARGEQRESSRAAIGRSPASRFFKTTLAHADRHSDPRELVRGNDRGAARASEGCDAREGEAPHGQRLRVESVPSSAVLADATSRGFAGHLSHELAKSIHAHPCSGGIGSQWSVEPNVGRVAYGVPSRVDRLRGLGNAVVPQIPEMIGRAIMQEVAA